MKSSKKVTSALQDGFAKKAEKYSGLKIKKYGLARVLIFVVIAALFFAVCTGLLMALVDATKGKAKAMGASAFGAIDGFFDKAFTPREEGRTDCALDKGNWDVWDGGTLIRTEGGYTLPQEATKGLFSYDEQIDSKGSYVIKFIPQGEQINFSLLIPNLYEIIIGDGDYQTVSLKKSDAIETPPTVVIEERQTGLSRPRLTYPIRPGTVVHVKVDEDVSEEKVSLTIEVTYLPAVGNNPARQIEKFFYDFTPATIDSTLHTLVIGIFRVLEDEERPVKVQFVCPRI